MLTGFVLGFAAASALWWFGIVTVPKIKEWYYRVHGGPST